MRLSVKLVSLAVLLASLSSFAGGQIRVVSDIDDTTKITNVGDTPLAIWNALFSSRAFAGMPEFYQSLSGSRGYSVEYLTAAPSLLKYRVLNFLDRNNFPEGRLHTKSPLNFESIKDYKRNVVLRLLQEFPEDLFIFIGDDTQSDFIAYDEVFQRQKDRILAIYIRRVTNRPLPPSAYGFLSAYDLARTEFLMHRLEVAEAAPVAYAILSEKRDNWIIPLFSYCPGDLLPLFGDEKIDEWNFQVSTRITEICEGRNFARTF